MAGQAYMLRTCKQEKKKKLDARMDNRQCDKIQGLFIVFGV